MDSVEYIEEIDWAHFIIDEMYYLDGPTDPILDKEYQLPIFSFHHVG